MGVPHRGLVDRIDDTRRLLDGARDALGLLADLPPCARRAVRAAFVRLRNAELELTEMRRQVASARQESP